MKRIWGDVVASLAKILTRKFLNQLSITDCLKLFTIVIIYIGGLTILLSI